MKTADKQALIQKLKEEPQNLTNDEKAQIISFINSKTYGLVWENSTEKSWEQMKDYIPVLVEDKDKAIIKDTEEQKNPNHILIEGDNLLALTNLCYTHAGKVDVIYIDPPYNTGNKDFVYNDKFVGVDDEYRHSKWLSFMNRRLQIAQKLLSPNGTIFISIDENELYQLKILCDQIFGDNNFLGQWNWFKSATPPALSLKVKRNIEYLIAYEKKKSQIKYNGIQKYSASNDPLTKSQNTIKELIFPSGSLNVKLPDGIISAGMYGTTKYPNELLCDMIVSNGKNANTVTFKNKFIWTQNTLDEEIQKGTRFDVSKQLVISYKRKEYDPEVPPNLINDSVGVGTTEEAGKRLNEIMKAKVFDYPKPVELVKYLIGFRSCSIVVDFFAGSGTTLQAVMQKNFEDNSHCQCILVQGKENKEIKEIDSETNEERTTYIDINICENVTYTRNKKVIEGYIPIDEQGHEMNIIPGLPNNNLRYFKVGFVPRDKDLTNVKRFAYTSVPLLCIKEDVYKEQYTLGNLECEGFRYFKDGDKQFIVILEPEMIEPIVEELEQMNIETRIPIYVFTTGHYPYTEDFWQVSEKVELYPYPTCVYGACEKVMPTMEDKLIAQPEGIELSEEEANTVFEDFTKE